MNNLSIDHSLHAGRSDRSVALEEFVVPHKGGQDPSNETTILTNLSFQSVARPVLFRTLPWGVARVVGAVLHASSVFN